MLILDKSKRNHYDISIYIKAEKKRSIHCPPIREDGPPAERQSRENMEKVALEPGF